MSEEDNKTWVETTPDKACLNRMMGSLSSKNGTEKCKKKKKKKNSCCSTSVYGVGGFRVKCVLALRHNSLLRQFQITLNHNSKEYERLNDLVLEM